MDLIGQEGGKGVNLLKKKEAKIKKRQFVYGGFGPPGRRQWYDILFKVNPAHVSSRNCMSVFSSGCFPRDFVLGIDTNFCTGLPFDLPGG